MPSSFDGRINRAQARASRVDNRMQNTRPRPGNGPEADAAPPPGGLGGPPGPPGGPGDPFGAKVVRAENVSSTLLRMARYFAKEAILTILMLVVVAASTVSSVIAPAYQSTAVDIIAGSVDEPFLEALGLMLLFYLIAVVCQFCEQVISAYLSQRIVSRMRNELFGRVIDLPVGYLDAHGNGDVMSRLTNDIDNISNTVSKSLSSMFSSVLAIIGSGVMMLWFCWQLALICFAVSLITLVATRLLSSQVRRYSRDRQFFLGNLNAIVEETVTGYRTVTAYNRQQACVDDFVKTSDDLTRAGILSESFAGSMGPVMNGINNVGFVVVAAFGGYFALQGMVSIGVISAFVIYEKQFGRPVSELAQIYGQLQSAVASAERVFALLDEDPEDLTGEPLEGASCSGDMMPSQDNKAAEIFAKANPCSVEMQLSDTNSATSSSCLHGSQELPIVFDHVTFGYEPGVAVLHDFTLEVPAGKKVALVGHTGSGKTTVANLLMRFYDPEQGTIYVGGQDISKVARPSLRKRCSIVLQDATLFSDTVRANLAYSNDEADEKAILAAAKASCSDDFIEQLPQGYETVLFAAGAGISQGQRQLLTIARAFVANPDILVLDEATSNVDTRTESVIQEAMKRIMKNRTSLVIAHRLSTIRDADIIVVLENGRIVEQGSHEELMALDGAYAALYEAQFEGLEV